MSHGSYECKLCGGTAFSRCINQRTLFPNDQGAAMLSHILKGSVERLGDGRVIVHLHVWGEEGEVGDISAFEDALQMIRTIQEESIKHWCCDHEWVCTSECMFGCCKPEGDQS